MQQRRELVNQKTLTLATNGYDNRDGWVVSTLLALAQKAEAHDAIMGDNIVVELHAKERKCQ